MQKSTFKLYNSVKDLMTQEQFEKELKKRYEEYCRLLDENAIALLIVDELGRYQPKVTKISELKANEEVNLQARVREISELKNFKRKNGSSGTLARLKITDGTCFCNLLLWDDDTKLVTNKKISKNTILKIINAQVKEGIEGLEVSKGKWGMIIVEPK